MSSSGDGYPTLIRIVRLAQRQANGTALAIILLLALDLAACRSDQQTLAPTPEKPMLTPAEPTAVVDDTSTLQAPRADPATIDGVLASGEWDDALSIDLDNGELLLMHDGSYLYAGIRSERLGLGSVCVNWDDEISILHSSAALGTATYVKVGDSWQKNRDFFWTNRDISSSEQALEARREHLETENWLASNGLMGKYSDMEYQIGLIDDKVHLAVTYLMSPDYTSTDFWPKSLGDGCRNFEPLQSEAPETVSFAPKTWMTVIASDR